MRSCHHKSSQMHLLFREEPQSHLRKEGGREKEREELSTLVISNFTNEGVAFFFYQKHMVG